MKPKHSTGHDGISNVLLKEMINEVSKSITLIINQSIKSGIFPDRLKIGRILPLFKKGDKSCIENYRPISLLPAISKIFEKVIFDQILDYFNTNKLFSDNQYGFRKQHSTELAAIELVDRITSKLDNGFTPFSIFLDLSKAFDTINHDILLNKFKYYGFCEPSLKLIESYLINRAQYVEMGHVKSKNVYLNCGVPQGSILGPLLFIVYVNDMSEASKLFNMLMYADDTTLMGSLEEFGITNKMNESGNLINLELLKIEMWLKLNMLSLNVQKSKFMIFFKHPKTVKPPVVKINHTEVECVDNFVFLGLVLNKHLSWKDHINRTANKISKVIGIMYKLKHVFPQEALLAIYRSLILPHLNYCILIWGNITKRLFKLQKRALRVIYKAIFVFTLIPSLKILDF